MIGVLRLIGKAVCRHQVTAMIANPTRLQGMLDAANDATPKKVSGRQAPAGAAAGAPLQLIISSKGIDVQATRREKAGFSQNLVCIPQGGHEASNRIVVAASAGLCHRSGSLLMLMPDTSIS